MAAALAEPVVLAAAKDALYPDLNNSPNHYAVTETQFTRATWGKWQIPPELRTRLAPFNTIRLSGGEPDLLGIGMPEPELLNAEAATAPVAVIEAKGHNSTPAAADVTQGITQAHAHLGEVNLGYVAAPLESITDSARSLARNLDIGIIGVENRQNATLVEPPRVRGAGDFSTTIDAIRFQATTHRLTEGSFPVNHPKNYLGYVLALAESGDTRDIYSEHIMRSVSSGRRGAILLGLVDSRPDGDALTHLGAEVVRFAREQHGSVSKALTQFNAWTGRSTRFTKLAPRWAQVARSVAIQYEPTRLIIEALEQLHQNGTNSPNIGDVTRTACQINQPLAVEVFFTQNRRADVLTPEGEINESALTDAGVYKSGVHFQFKYQLYHVGLLTVGGTDDKTNVMSNEWRLEHSVHS